MAKRGQNIDVDVSGHSIFRGLGINRYWVSHGLIWFKTNQCEILAVNIPQLEGIKPSEFADGAFNIYHTLTDLSCWDASIVQATPFLENIAYQWNIYIKIPQRQDPQ